MMRTVEMRWQNCWPRRRFQQKGHRPGLPVITVNGVWPELQPEPQVDNGPGENA